MTGEKLGEYLKRERELRGISIEEVAEGTKIAIHMLRAMEADQWSRMPAEIFTRGFLRSYAEFIGLSPDDIILRHEEEKALETENTRKSEERGRGLPFGTGGNRPVFAILAAILILIAIAGGIYFFSRPAGRETGGQPAGNDSNASAVLPSGTGKLTVKTE